MVGVDPDPFTLRQLDWMAHGKRFDAWDRTSLLAALIHNDPLGARRRLKPEHFNPFIKKKPRKMRRTSDINFIAREFGAIDAEPSQAPEAAPGQGG